MILGHIGVRAGSKGVPRKNFKEICGRPLIDWSLDQLFEHPLVDQVVVSTDDPEIYEHALARGTLAIGLRPGHLATDAAGKWGVWQHALGASEALIGEVSAFVDLDATSPLRLPEDITGAIELYQSEGCDMVMACCEAPVNPYFNLLEPDASGALHVSKPLPGGVVARQSAPPVYQHATGTYIVRPEYLKQAKALFEGRVLPYVVDVERSLDIDSPLDFQLVSFLLAERLKAEGAC